PHRPNEAAITGTELQTMSAVLPTENVTRLAERVPRFHRRCRIVVAHRRVTLHVEKRGAHGTGPTETDAINLQLRNDIGEIVLVIAMHGQSRESEGSGVHSRWTQNLVPGYVALL